MVKGTILRPSHSKMDSRTIRPSRPLRPRTTEVDSKKEMLLIQRSEAPKIASMNAMRSGSPKKMASRAELSRTIRSLEELWLEVTQDLFGRSRVKDRQGVRQSAQ